MSLENLTSPWNDLFCNLNSNQSCLVSKEKTQLTSSLTSWATVPYPRVGGARGQGCMCCSPPLTPSVYLSLSISPPLFFYSPTENYTSRKMADHHDLPYQAEYAKSNRSTCKACRTTISQKSLRLAVMVQVSKSDQNVNLRPIWGYQKTWFIRRCFSFVLTNEAGPPPFSAK